MSKPKERPGFMLYHTDLENAFSCLSDRDCGKLLKMLYAESTGKQMEETKMNAGLKATYLMMRQKIAQDAERYEETCQRNRENALKRHQKAAKQKLPPHAVAEIGMPNLPNINVTPTVNVNSDVDLNSDVNSVVVVNPSAPAHRKTTHPQKADTDSTHQDQGTRAAPFVPPAQQEVLDYARSLGKTIDAEKFMDYNQCRGWRVGSAPMQDWRAAVRRWIQGDENRTPGNAYPARRVSAQMYQQRQYTEEELNGGLAHLLEEAKKDSESS